MLHAPAGEAPDHLAPDGPAVLHQDCPKSQAWLLFSGSQKLQGVVWWARLVLLSCAEGRGIDHLIGEYIRAHSLAFSGLGPHAAPESRAQCIPRLVRARSGACREAQGNGMHDPGGREQESHSQALGSADSSGKGPPASVCPTARGAATQLPAQRSLARRPLPPPTPALNSVLYPTRRLL